MPKLRKFNKSDGTFGGYTYHCPGCELAIEHGFYHAIYADWLNKPTGWKFNGNEDSPTFSPSFKMTQPRGDITHICHIVMTNGRIEYCADCTHPLAGQTIEMKDA